MDEHAELGFAPPGEAARAGGDLLVRFGLRRGTGGLGSSGLLRAGGSCGDEEATGSEAEDEVATGDGIMRHAFELQFGTDGPTAS